MNPLAVPVPMTGESVREVCPPTHTRCAPFEDGWMDTHVSVGTFDSVDDGYTCG